MNKLKQIVNNFLEQIGKKDLVILAFEKKDVSFSGYNIKHFETTISFLNNNLISAYESGDVTSAARIRGMIIDVNNEKKKLENKIKEGGFIE